MSPKTSNPEEHSLATPHDHVAEASAQDQRDGFVTPAQYSPEVGRINFENLRAGGDSSRPLPAVPRMPAGGDSSSSAYPTLAPPRGQVHLPAQETANATVHAAMNIVGSMTHVPDGGAPAAMAGRTGRGHILDWGRAWVLIPMYFRVARIHLCEAGPAVM